MSDIGSTPPMEVPSGFQPAPSVADEYYHGSGVRRVVGLALLGGAIATTGAVAYAEMHHDTGPQFGVEVPFNQELQTAINDLNPVLRLGGLAAFPLAVGSVGAVKLLSRRSPLMKTVDEMSSRELTVDDVKPESRTKKVLSAVAAGSIPGVAVSAVALGSFTSAISSEIQYGPDRPINGIEALDPHAGELIAQFEGAMPMVRSDLKPQFVDHIVSVSNKDGVSAVPITLSLGGYSKVKNGPTSYDLVIGMPSLSNSQAENWDGNCDNVPVVADSSAGIKDGSVVYLDNIEAHVVGQTSGISAIDRDGFEARNDAVQVCVDQGDMNASLVLLGTHSSEQAQSILNEAQDQSSTTNPAVEMPVGQYKANSEHFWAQAEPVTNILESAALMLSAVAIGASMRNRLIRNRSEWSTKLASGMADKMLRITEVMRSLKDGVLATAIGAPIGAAGTMVANMAVQGFESTFKLIEEGAVGASVGIAGSLIGITWSLLRPRQTVKVKDSLR